VKILVIGGLGYVGSIVVKHLVKNPENDISILDFSWFGGTVPTNVKLLSEDVRDVVFNQMFDWYEWDCILYFAGHSSVPMCNEDVNGSYLNNVDTFRLILSKFPSNIPFIYASSSSVYGGSDGKICKEIDYYPPTDQYSMTKVMRDQLALISNRKTFGLRFGTVCGYSPNPRPELLVNVMTLNALEKHKITVTNPMSQRPTLGTKDLVRAIETIIQQSSTAKSGVYNLASTHGTILDTAEAVCSVVKCDLEVLGNTGGYSFDIDTSKFEKEFGFKFEQDLSDIIYDIVINQEVFKTGIARKGRRYAWI